MLIMTNNRALSPVVAVVLLVALTLVLSSMVFSWGREFIGEPVEASRADCEMVSLNIEVVENLGSGVYSLNFLNTGNVQIVNLTLVKTLGGDEFLQELPYGLISQKPYNYQILISINGQVPEDVSIYPKILKGYPNSQSVQVLCKDRGVSVNLD